MGICALWAAKIAFMEAMYCPLLALLTLRISIRDVRLDSEALGIPVAVEEELAAGAVVEERELSLLM
jgi:hypothetical protein